MILQNKQIRETLPTSTLHDQKYVDTCSSGPSFGAGNVVLAFAKPRLVRQTARWGSVFPLLQSPMAASYTKLKITLGIEYGDLRLVCSFLAMETHSDVASGGSLEFGNEFCN